MKWVRSFSEIISRFENLLLVIFVLFMIGLSFVQVVLRNFFSSGFDWADICLRNIVLWVGFIGASLATRDNRHITVDALTNFLSPRLKLIAEFLTSIVSVGIGCVFIWASVSFVHSEYEAESLAFLGISFWMVEIIIPVGFGLITLRFFLKAMEDFSKLFARWNHST